MTALAVSLGVVAVVALVLVWETNRAAITAGPLGIATRRRRMQNKISDLSDHFIVCAYGRVGRAVAREFESEGVRFVIIDSKTELEDLMRTDGVLYLIADPTREQILRRAGIERARGLICAVDSDAAN